VQVRWCGARAGCKLSSPKPLSIRWSRSSQPNSHTFHSRNLKNQTLVSHSLRAQSCTSAPALHLHCTCSLSVCRCGVSSPLPVGFCHASDRLRRQSTRLSLRCRRREGWNGSGFWWVRVPQYHYGSASALAFPSSTITTRRAACLFRVGSQQQHGDRTAKDGRQITAHTSLCLWYSFCSPRCGPRAAVYLSYTVTERTVACRGWWTVLVVVTALATISSVVRRCTDHHPRFATVKHRYISCLLPS
jgi:hypothetical protein